MTDYQEIAYAVLIGTNVIDPERPICTAVQKRCVFFGAHLRKMNENRPILSAAKIYVNDSSFRHVGHFRYSKAFLGELSSNQSKVDEMKKFAVFPLILSS